MNSSRRSPFDHLRLGLIGVLIAGSVCIAGCGQRHAEATPVGAPGQAQTIAPLSADDVSLLFPAPTRVEDFSNLIAVRDLTTQNAQDPTKRDPVWPDAVFQQFVAIAAGPAATVAGTQNRIGLPVEAQSIEAWFSAGSRVDAGTPGLSNDIREQFGQLPEIRLIIQPVIRNPDGTPKVFDIAGHLIFDFKLKNSDLSALPDCSPRPRPRPDLDSFNTIVADLAALRTKLSDGQLGAHKVRTSGVLLGVYPGLADPTTANNVRQEIKSFLEKHISGDRLDALAITGLPAGAPAPWIFLSMLNLHPGDLAALPKGALVPVHGPTLDGEQFAQMLAAAGGVPRVVPVPHTNNLNSITCKNAAVSTTSLPVAERTGVSTAELFVTPPPPADKTQQIVNVIADPAKSHFFNTDCVSCHTETRRSMELLNIKDIPGIDPAVLPNGQWDVRNFGWSPSGKGPVQATVTRRTAAETNAVVMFINSELLGKP